MSWVCILCNLFAYAIFQSAAFFVWMSRKNAPAINSLPFIVVGFFIPLVAVDYGKRFDLSVIDKLTAINSLGALSLVAGLVIGRLLAKNSCGGFGKFCITAKSDGDKSDVSKRLNSLMLLGLVGMVFCFLWIGTFPMFAEDPFLAKFFRGDYKEKYDQVAVIYRLSQTAVNVSMPFAIALFVEKKSIKNVVLIAAAMLVLSLAMTRGSVMGGVMICLAVMAGKTRARTTIFILFSVGLVSFGSTIYAVLGMKPIDDNLLLNIASGAPDIEDQLTFLSEFDLEKDITFGRTFLGGLIPGNFYYNPSVFSLAIANGTDDVSQMASGGFRMPPSIWGYTAFGWFGVFLVCSISGCIMGYASKYVRRMASETSLYNKVVVALWYLDVVEFAAKFYQFSYIDVVGLIMMLYVVGWFRPIQFFSTRNR